VTSVPGDGSPVHLAVIHGPHEIHGVVAARDRKTLLARLAQRLQEDVQLQLFPADAQRFRTLVGEDQLEEALRLYAAKVGRKWDPVRLRVEVVELD